MKNDFDGAAFHPGLEQGKESGTVTVRSFSIQFRGETANVELPFDRMHIRLGGASDRLVFFEHPAYPEWSVYTSDREILRHPEIVSNPELQTALHAIRKGRLSNLGILVTVGVVTMLLLVGLLRLKDPLIAAAARRVPISVEKKLGDAGFAQITLTQKTVADERITKPLQQIVRRLQDRDADRHYEFRLFVVEDSTVNAFALPGGTMIVNTGLILEARSAEEIAGVLAHEIAHVSHQHSVRQIISSLGLFALVQAFFGDVSGIVAVVAQGGTELLSRRFSRDFEREADDAGLEALARSKIDPRGMLTFFALLREKEKKLGAMDTVAGSLSLLSTHPATEERIERIEERIAGLPSRFEPVPVDIDLDSIKQWIRTTTTSAEKEP